MRRRVLAALAAVANTGSAAWSAWTVTFTFPGDQKIPNAWNATITQSGTAVSAVNELQRQRRGGSRYQLRLPGHLDEQRRVADLVQGEWHDLHLIRGIDAR